MHHTYDGSYTHVNVTRIVSFRGASTIRQAVRTAIYKRVRTRSMYWKRTYYVSCFKVLVLPWWKAFSNFISYSTAARTCTFAGRSPRPPFAVFWFIFIFYVIILSIMFSPVSIQVVMMTMSLQKKKSRVIKKKNLIFKSKKILTEWIDEGCETCRTNRGILVSRYVDGTFRVFVNWLNKLESVRFELLNGVGSE